VPKILFLLAPEDDPERISAALREEGCETTPVRDFRTAAALLRDGTHDALVLGEPVCRSLEPEAARDLVRLARGLGMPVALFPRDEPPLLAAGPKGRPPRRLSRGRIERIFNERIRPALQARGGDVELVDVRDGGVVLRFLGVCTLCPAARSRHLAEIEELLRAEAPELREVEIEPEPAPGGRGG
jgi:Fe-S cluster biogenesis protein NfuA